MDANPDQGASVRARLAFLLLFVFVVGLGVGAYFIRRLGQVQESNAARKGLAALQGATAPAQIDEALRQHPSSKPLQMVAMAAKAANETSAAAETLLNQVAPPALAKNINLATAGRDDLEAFRRDLKVAEAHADALMPRYLALVKTERDRVESYARSLNAEKDIVGRFLDGVDGRQAKATAVMSRLVEARADYYRAYQSYVSILIGEFGAYKVVDGQFIFSLQRTVDRYNVAVHDMAVATKNIAESEADRKALTQSQQQGWEQVVNGK
jgi:hypothetical protein